MLDDLFSLSLTRSCVLIDWNDVNYNLTKHIPRYSTSSSSSVASSVAALAPFKPSALSAHVIVRGDDDGAFNDSRTFAQIDKKLQALFPPIDWNPFVFDYKVTPLPPLSMQTALPAPSDRPTRIPRGRSITTCVNRSRIVEYLTETVTKANAMLEARAYVHWYERFGCGMEEFLHSAQVLEDVIADYHTMCR